MSSSSSSSSSSLSSPGWVLWLDPGSVRLQQQQPGQLQQRRRLGLHISKKACYHAYGCKRGCVEKAYLLARLHFDLCTVRSHMCILPA